MTAKNILSAQRDVEIASRKLREQEQHLLRAIAATMLATGELPPFSVKQAMLAGPEADTDVPYDIEIPLSSLEPPYPSSQVLLEFKNGMLVEFRPDKGLSIIATAKCLKLYPNTVETLQSQLRQRLDFLETAKHEFLAEIAVDYLDNLATEGATWLCPDCDRKIYGLFGNGRTEHECECGKKFVLTISAKVDPKT